MRVIIQEEALRRSEGHHYHRFIQELPTIDAVPVVHGRWEEIRNAYRELEGWLCKCGCESKVKSKYCPNCGAKMDAEESSND